MSFQLSKTSRGGGAQAGDDVVARWEGEEEETRVTTSIASASSINATRDVFRIENNCKTAGAKVVMRTIVSKAVRTGIDIQLNFKGDAVS